MNTVIQKARLEDAFAIAEVHITSLNASHRELLPTHLAYLVLGQVDTTKRARSWEKWLKRSQTSTVVACVEDTVIGFCTLHPVSEVGTRGTTGEIAAIYVLPSYWRRGVGRLLCEHIIAEAHRQALQAIVLWVLESNERARHFYSSLGFQPTGEKRVFLEDGGVPLHELRYRKELSPMMVG